MGRFLCGNAFQLLCIAIAVVCKFQAQYLYFYAAMNGGGNGVEMVTVIVVGIVNVSALRVFFLYKRRFAPTAS